MVLYIKVIKIHVDIIIKRKDIVINEQSQKEKECLEARYFKASRL